jgi:hypothetical protein
VHLMKNVCFLNLSTHCIYLMHSMQVALQILYLAFRVLATADVCFILIILVHFNGGICLVLLMLGDRLSYPLKVDNNCIGLIVLLIMKIIIRGMGLRWHLFFLRLLLMALIKIDGVGHFLHKLFATTHSRHIVRGPIFLLFRHRMTLTYI